MIAVLTIKESTIQYNGVASMFTIVVYNECDNDKFWAVERSDVELQLLYDIMTPVDAAISRGYLNDGVKYHWSRLNKALKGIEGIKDTNLQLHETLLLQFKEFMGEASNGVRFLSREQVQHLFSPPKLTRVQAFGKM